METKKYIDTQMELIKQEYAIKLRTLNINDVILEFYCDNHSRIGSSVNEIVKQSVDRLLIDRKTKIFDKLIRDIIIKVIQSKHRVLNKAISIFDIAFIREDINYFVEIHTQYENNMVISGYHENKTVEEFTYNHNQPNRKIIGFTYGVKAKISKSNTVIIFGNDFWSFISGSRNLYPELIKPLHEVYSELDIINFEQYCAKINLLEKDFIESFCQKSGKVSWDDIRNYKLSLLVRKMSA